VICAELEVVWKGRNEIGSPTHRGYTQAACLGSQPLGLDHSLLAICRATVHANNVITDVEEFYHNSSVCDCLALKYCNNSYKNKRSAASSSTSITAPTTTGVVDTTTLTIRPESSTATLMNYTVTNSAPATTADFVTTTKPAADSKLSDIFMFHLH